MIEMAWEDILKGARFSESALSGDNVREPNSARPRFVGTYKNSVNLTRDEIQQALDAFSEMNPEVTRLSMITRGDKYIDSFILLAQEMFFGRKGEKRGTAERAISNIVESQRRN